MLKQEWVKNLFADGKGERVTSWEGLGFIVGHPPLGVALFSIYPSPEEEENRVNEMVEEFLHFKGTPFLPEDNINLYL